jgi:peptidoglycan biosynthesis protein MviN/MurJ (putative lipid II flippase)
LIGWSLLELTSRSLFALNRPRLPIGVAVIPVLFNLALAWLVPYPQPQWIGLGASAGFLIAFLLLLTLIRVNRRRWLIEAKSPAALETA